MLLFVGGVFGEVTAGLAVEAVDPAAVDEDQEVVSSTTRYRLVLRVGVDICAAVAEDQAVVAARPPVDPCQVDRQEESH